MTLARPRLARFGFAALAGASALTLAACNDESSLPRSGRHYVPLSLAMQESIREKGMRTHAPILIRAFKQESELEVWKQDSSGKMALLKTFPMCRWSGQLGPKTREGDRQVPEGFYTFNAGQMNPNSSFYLSFNIGYPNAVDRQLGRTGAHIMVHGDCSSMGCFAMTDGQIADIYALTREAFAGGQSAIQLQSYPFRMTPENMAKFRNDPNIGFWKTLKQGDAYFEESRQTVQTAACNGRYSFGVSECGGAKASSELSSAVASRVQRDEMKVAELTRTIRPVKRIYRDGDMHQTFKPTMVAGGSVGTVRNGISRPDALAFTPVEIPLEQYKNHKAKGRTYPQIAELVQQEQVNGAMAGDAATAEPAKPAEPARPSIATPAAPAGRQPARPATAVAQAPAQQPIAAAAATALAPAEPQPSMFQRMLSGVGLGGSQPAAPPEAKVEEVTPQRVNVPLPPRRQAGAPAPGPQAAAPAVQPGQPAPAAGKVSEIISDTQRLAPASSAGFVKQP
jgi:murein L,D-transpeptidase YafK